MITYIRIALSVILIWINILVDTSIYLKMTLINTVFYCIT